MQKHKHFDTIIAWASGHQVQLKEGSGKWVTVTWTPTWELNREYRVAPKCYSIGDIFVDPLEPGGPTTKYMLVSVANDQVMLIVIDGAFKGARHSDAKLKVDSCIHVPSDEFAATWPDLQKVEK